MTRESRLNPLMTLVDLNKQIDAEYEPETAALFARMTVRPDNTRRHAIDTLVSSLKTNGLWSKLDGLYLFAAHTSQAGLLNWCRTEANFTAINSPVFTADVGFTGDGVGASLSNVNSATVKTQALDMTTAVWVSKVPVVPQTSNAVWWTGWNWSLAPGQTATQIAWRLARTGATTTASSRTGLFSFSRTAATVASVYRDGSKIGTETGTYDAAGNYLVTAPIRVFSANGTANFTTDTVSALAYGSSMTDAQHTTLYTAINNYMTAVNLAANLGI
jgi:hypothetical protein